MVCDDGRPSLSVGWAGRKDSRSLPGNSGPARTIEMIHGGGRRRPPLIRCGQSRAAKVGNWLATCWLRPEPPYPTAVPVGRHGCHLVLLDSPIVLLLLPERLGHPAFGKSKAFPQRHGRRTMTQADNDDAHLPNKVRVAGPPPADCRRPGMGRRGFMNGAGRKTGW